MKSLRRNMFRAVAGHLPASLNMIPASAPPARAYPHRRRAHGTSMGIDVALRYQEELLKIVQVRHHDAHAAIFFASPFDEAAVLVLDGHGDETAQSAHFGAGNRLQRLWQSEVFD